MSIYISGVGHCFPDRKITNDDFAKVIETSDEWIYSRTGIKTRGYASGVPTWKMGVIAAKEAIENAGIEASEIGLIITSTITADFFTPSVSCLVAGELGLTCPAFDVGAACSGFVYALDTAERYLRTDDSLKYALVISSEMLSRYTNFGDRSSAIIFGDGAGAVVIQRREARVQNTEIYGAYLGSDGSGGKHLYGKLPFPSYPFYDYAITDMEDYPGPDNVIVQNGKEVYKFAVKAMPAAIEKALERAGITPAEVDFFIPHQANIRIIETAAKTMGIPLEKFIVNIETHANTSSASIPLALYDAVKDGQIKRGDTICVCGFGAGLTFGAMVFEF
ncbi:MAG: ketoacyl-ACP synthase III [Ruminococcus sp.]|jgi:3-oxoacyl-[acyl-carrier-protein] synthase-3|nr:ketoacyl-ACP synthase III [Ruminococcus sp.]